MGRFKLRAATTSSPFPADSACCLLASLGCWAAWTLASS